MTCDVTYDSDGKQVGDADLFAGMKGSMKILNFSEPEQSEIWKMVATVLHLGNLDFGGKIMNNNTFFYRLYLLGNCRQLAYTHEYLV